MTAELNDKILESVNSLMVEENRRTEMVFEKVSPLVNEIFSALANYDIRFEFASFSLDSPNVEKIVENEYTVLCPLKELPENNLRLEGKVATGVLTVRLSRVYEDSIEKVCWADITLPADSKGCQFFSTKKLLNVLIEAVKHAINDVIPSDEENNNKDKSVTCKQRNDMAVLEIKVPGHCVKFNLLPCIPLNREIMKSLAMEGRISRVTKHMGFTTTECAYLVAKPLTKHPETLWRITVNNIENSVLSKICGLTECANHCLFALTLMNEQFFTENKNKGLVPYYLTRMAFLQEFLKFPNASYWKSGYFTARVESLLHSFEGNVSKRDFKNIFTGVNIVAHREKDKLTQLTDDIARVLSEFRRYFN